MANLQTYLQQPQNFLYIYASDSFIKKLGSTAAYVISRKKANQKKLLTVAAGGTDNYNPAFTQMAQAFKNMFGMSPQEALITLAQGGEVAGKNWSKGIYGVGKPIYVNFSGQGVNSNVAINENGQFIDKSTGRALTTEIVSYDRKGNVNCARYTDPSGNIYTANWTKKTGWAAGQCAVKNGGIFNADGSVGTPADSANIWESVIVSVQKIVEWLISLFNANNNAQETPITPANTQPSQGDGWRQEAGVSPWIIVAVAAGTLLASGGLGGFMRSAKKSKK